MPNINKDYKKPVKKRKRSRTGAAAATATKATVAPVKSINKKQKQRNNNQNNNLNHQLTTTRSVPKRTLHGTVFLTNDIAEFLTRQLSLCDEAFICTPYISSATPLYEAFSKMNKTTIITAPAKGLKTKAQREMFERWSATVFTVGKGSGKKKSIAHSKYIIGVKNNELMFATTGSYNITGGSPTNIENIVCFFDTAMKNFIKNEFQQILKITKKFT